MGLGKEGRRRTDEFLSQAFLAIEKIVAELGYECVNVALVTEDGRSLLRVMIDSIGGINIGDCETISNAINRWLDAPYSAETGELGNRYYLEVSSPGLERPLFTPADYARFRGKEVRIRTSELVDGRKNHVGFLIASDETSVTINTEQGYKTLHFDDVTHAALVFRGLEPQPPKKRNAKRNQERKSKSVEEVQSGCS